MVHRPRRGLVAVLIALLASGCAPAAGDVASTEAVSGSDLSTATSPSTTSPSSAITTAGPKSATAATRSLEADVDVSVPGGQGPFPAVVLVHGGGWVTGDSGIMDPLARLLNASGYLTVNANYTLATLERPSFPEAVEDVACAVRLAASHPDSDGTVALIGHSAGAHLGAVVALTGDAYEGRCKYRGTGVPQRFVGLAGPYDVSRLGLAVAAFFGQGPDRLPEEWEAGNPQHLTDENPQLESLIMYGSEDGLVSETFAIDFYDALVEAGSDALLEVVEDAHHNDMRDPEVVGDLVLTWLAR